MNRDAVRRFLFPSLSPPFFVRAAVVGLGAFLFFSYVCIPFRIQGLSMAPTYGGFGVNFCWTPRFLLSPPKRHDVVLVRLAGKRVMLMKRVVGLEGEEVAFYGGRLLINGNPVDEPYVQYPCDWDLPARTVKPAHVYVVGDNRNMPLEQHRLGQVALARIQGGPLW